MKKITTLVMLLFTAASMALAQNTVNVDPSGDRAYNEGDKIFQFGVGFGYYGYGFTGTRSVSIPPLTASLEFGFHENFSVGPYVGYASWDYNFTSYDYGWDFLAVGARGSFHYVPLANEALDLNLNEEKLDFYISLFLGLEFQSFSGDTGFGSTDVYSNNTVLRLSPVLGFKYKFNDKFGAYFEAGRGALSVATLGLAVHF